MCLDYMLYIKNIIEKFSTTFNLGESVVILSKAKH